MNMATRVYVIKGRIEHEFGRERKIGVIGGEDAVHVLIQGRAINNDQRQLIEDMILEINKDCVVMMTERIDSF